MQEPEVGWDVVAIHRDPSVATRIYALVLLASLLAGLVHLIRNWWTVRPFARNHSYLDNSSMLFFRTQAKSINRWIPLDLLAWMGVTLAGVQTSLRGLAMQKAFGWALSLDLLRDLSQPTALLLWVITPLFLLRWHILWRLERFERKAIQTNP
jgi:hypothetical protein